MYFLFVDLLEKINQRLIHMDKKLDAAISILIDVRRKEVLMTQEFDNLSAQVEATETLEDSAIALINGLAAQIAAAKDDPAKIQALADSLQTKAELLSVALTANTPAAPAPEAPATGSVPAPE